MDWIEIADRLGVPVAILAAIGIVAWTYIRAVTIPNAKAESKARVTMMQQLGEGYQRLTVNDTRQTAILGELRQDVQVQGRKIDRIEQKLSGHSIDTKD